MTSWKHFDDRMRYLEKQLKSTGLPSNYARMSLHGSIAWMQYTFPEEEGLKVGLHRRRWDTTFEYEIMERNRKERKEGIAR